MNRLKAESKIRRKATKVKTCPFCGEIPEVIASCDYSHSKHGSWGHYANRKPCCKTTGLGQSEIFFTNNFKKPDYRLWWRCFNSLIDDWNKRV